MKYKIGDKVIVAAKTVVQYNQYGRKYSEKLKLNQPISAYITGACHKRIGEYRAASVCQSLDGAYQDPAYLEVHGTVFVYRCRVGMFSKEFDVQPEDVLENSEKE